MTRLGPIGLVSGQGDRHKTGAPILPLSLAAHYSPIRQDLLLVDRLFVVIFTILMPQASLKPPLVPKT